MTRLSIIFVLVFSVLGAIVPAVAATRTAIMKQEEAQTERSVQLRAADPGAPVTNQYWLNTTDNITKYYNGSTNVQVGAKNGSNSDITGLSGLTGSIGTPTLLNMAEQGSDPSTPSASERKIYAKSDGLYQKNSAGVVTKVGAGGSPVIAISASDINWALGNVFTKTLAANTTFTFSNQEAGQVVMVRLTNTASNYTVTWPVGVLWSGGTAPTQTIGAKSDVYTFIYDGTTTYGSVVQNF